MDKMSNLENRLKEALARVGQGVAKLDADVLAQGMNAKQAELEAAQAMAQTKSDRIIELEAKVSRLENVIADHTDQQSELIEVKKALVTLEVGLNDMLAANSNLIETNAALIRGEQLPDAALQAEIEALRAERAVERQQISVLAAALGPLVGGYDNA